MKYRKTRSYIGLITGLLSVGLWLTTAAQEPAAEGETSSTYEAVITVPAPNPEPVDESPVLHRETMVVFGQHAELKTNETTEVLVVIGGDATVRGKVRGPAVAILGNLKVEGSVDEEAVAVLGNIHAGPHARIGGDAVSVGGRIDAEKGGRINGSVQEIGGGGLADLFGGFSHWFVQCVLKMRPMAPSIGWLWVVAGVSFLVYLLISAVFRRPVEACLVEVRERPATSFLIGMLSLILFPLILAILGFTLVGLIVVPFLMAAAVIAVLLGKAAIFEWIGQSLGMRVRGGKTIPWLLALSLGFLIVLGLYCVPFLGLVVYTVLAVWGLGVATIALFAGFRRELPEKAPPVPVPVYQPAPAPMMAGAPYGSPAQNFSAPPPVAGGAPGFAVPPSIPPAPAPYLGRASFWERMGAAFLDIILVGIIAHLIHGPAFALLVALAYFAGMWAWKGTTIGGIVLGIKVVRLDGRPVNLLVALVRGMAAGFSTMVLFLGFLWIIWDADKQGWHDKIAGTVVVRTPRGTSLVCF
jgi:uncharacterized RDD family membrane protein YckC